jgi:hypothetical protein
MVVKAERRIGASTGFRPTPVLRRTITAWIKRQADNPSFEEAVCRLLELGLAAPGDCNGQKYRARTMASAAIDRLADATTTPAGRAARKRDLLNGPEEFSRDRLDRPARDDDRPPNTRNTR